MGPLKEYLVEKVAAMGFPDPESLTKAELIDEIERRDAPEVGAHVPPGQIAPEPLKASRTRRTGIQPVTTADIPEAGR